MVIDCCPFLGVLSLNAVFAADRLLVPISSDFLALRGALQVERTLQALEPVLKRNDWNDYTIIGRGRSIKIILSGVTTVDYTEEDTTIPQTGKSGL